jgi:hypothetical protein
LIVELDEAFADAPLVLLEEYASELGEVSGAVSEHAEDGFAVVDRQSENLRLAFVGGLELVGGRFSAVASRLASRSLPASVRTRRSGIGMPARNIAGIVSSDGFSAPRR